MRISFRKSFKYLLNTYDMTVLIIIKRFSFHSVILTDILTVTVEVLLFFFLQK
jgi:hypothetical protein